MRTAHAESQQEGDSGLNEQVSLYAAVIGNCYPHKSRIILSYQALIIGEHRQSGGIVWLLYDSAFRQQVTLVETTDLSKLNLSLCATTLVWGEGAILSKLHAARPYPRGVYAESQQSDDGGPTMGDRGRESR